MNARPLVTVCVATYNQHGMIEQCLRSILHQEAAADTIVLVGDDASSDGTADVVDALVREYGPVLRHYRRDANLGPYANMCDLLARAEGDFIARVDGDDFWLPGKLQRQLDVLQGNPDCAAVYTNAITVDPDGARRGLFNDVGDRRFDLAELLARGNVLNNSSVLFRAEHIPGWIARPDQIDFQVHLWLARRGWLYHLGEPLAAYRVGGQASLTAASGDRVRELYWQAIQSVPRELISDHDYACAIADFLRRVLFRSAKARDARLTCAWARCVYSASPYGRVRTTNLVAANVLRAVAKMFVGQVVPGNRSQVLYRR